DKLRKTALLRVEHPELTLTQLAELCDPPVTKSCLNHRLRKLIALAGEPQTETAPDCN
ncbi:MAG: DNA-binding protein WhiA, partial [Pseudoflavonifractor sp.]